MSDKTAKQLNPQLNRPNPQVGFPGRRVVISPETLVALGKPLPPNRPEGRAVVELCDGEYYWVEVL